MASTALGTQASGWFIGGTRKERRCFAAERGPDPFEHTRALEGPFFDPNPRARTSALAFIEATRKDRPCFAAERGLDRLGHASLRMVYWRHTKGTALFCCRTRPRPALGTHEHSRVHFLNWDPSGVTLVFARCGLQPNRVWGRVYWSHTKRTALFCCRTWPRPPWAHKPPDGLLAAHERNGAVLLQNAAPTRFGHTRALEGPCSKLGLAGLVVFGQDVASSQIGLGQSLLEPHEKNGPVLLQNVASTALGTQASGWFIGGTRKERRCFAAERGPDPFEHTRALEGPFFDPNPLGQGPQP